MESPAARIARLNRRIDELDRLRQGMTPDEFANPHFFSNLATTETTDDTAEDAG